MSRSFTGNTRLEVANVPTGVPCTFVIWYKVTSTASGSQAAFGVGGATFHYRYLGRFSNDAYAIERDSSSAQAAANQDGIPNNSWVQVAGIFSSATSRRAAVGSTLGTIVSTSKSPSPTRLVIGERPDNFGDDFVGLLAHASLFDYALTSGQLGDLAGGVSPMAMATPPVFYLPMKDDVAHLDLAGGLTLTATGSPAHSTDNPTVDDPPVLDTDPPVANIVTGPSLTKISDETGKDSTDIEVQVNESCQAWKCKVVPAEGSIHTAGTEIESGGAVVADGTIEVNITHAELAAAGGEGDNLVKFFFQDDAGNWSL